MWRFALQSFNVFNIFHDVLPCPNRGTEMVVQPPVEETPAHQAPEPQAELVRKGAAPAPAEDQTPVVPAEAPPPRAVDTAQVSKPVLILLMYDFRIRCPLSIAFFEGIHCVDRRLCMFHICLSLCTCTFGRIHIRIIKTLTENYFTLIPVIIHWMRWVFVSWNFH